jgi:hypothetical protein
MEALKYLIHYYSNEEFLFQTVTMYKAIDRNKVCDSIASSRSWYWGRFSRSDRAAYMLRRVAAEKMLRTEFENSHWPLKSKSPVYLYLIPNMSLDNVDRDLGTRKEHEEHKTKYLLFDLDRIQIRSDITFTLDDSFRSYRKKLLDQGIACRGLNGKVRELADYGRVFHIDELVAVYTRNSEVPDLRFEIQVWDREILTTYLQEQK